MMKPFVILIQLFSAIAIFFIVINVSKLVGHPSFLTHRSAFLNDSIAQNDSIRSEGIYQYRLFKSNVHASYYAQKFNGRKTANGEIFDNQKLTAAHRTLPFGAQIRVTNVANDQSIIVYINDRGPFVRGREIDLTKKGFELLGAKKGQGQMRVTLEIIETLISEATED